MTPPIQVSYHRFNPTEDTRRRVEALVGRLDRHAGRIIGGRVVLEGAHRHGDQTEVEVHVELDLPGRGKAVGKRSATSPAASGHSSITDAVAEAIRAAEAQMQKHMQKLSRHAEKQPAQPPRYGRVQRLDRDRRNGFIETADSGVLFFSEAVLLNCDFEALEPGSEVIAEAAASNGPYGPQAASVRLSR